MPPRSDRRRLGPALAAGGVLLVVAGGLLAAASGMVTAVTGVPARLYTRWFPPAPPPTLAAVTEQERRAWRAVGERLPGRLVWSSNREGNHDLYLVDLATGSERRLTDHPHVDFFSRFSPDGRLVSFLRSQRPWVSFRDETSWDLYVTPVDGGEERRLVEGAYHPTWRPDGRAIVYVHDNRIHEVDLETGTPSLLHVGSDPPTGGRTLEPELSTDGLLAVTLRGVPRETVGVVDLGTRAFTPLSTERACQITWFPGRPQLVWIDPGGHGGTRVMTATLGDPVARTLIDLPGDHSHEYFPRVTADGRWLVWGASAEGHEHDRADYELFVWEIGEPWSTAARLTFSPANDQWPDLLVTEP